MTILPAIGAVALCLSSTMAGAWWLALRTGRSGWIDAAWSFAVGASGAALAVWPTTGAESGVRQALVAAMSLGWSLRLGIHISLRTANGGDDPRYRHLREEWGDSFKVRLFWFLQIQALAALVLASSIMIAARNPSPGLGIGDGIGVAILALAILGEGLADSQLSNFRSKPENREKVCDVGLWSLSRHPNYFFEWLAWLAYPFIAIDPAGGYPLGWLALAAPLLMYRLLVHVSGIPPLEAHMLRSRGPAFRDYQQRVNAFWPGRPTTAGRGV
jgi:steroid 5-alpha reductase family enzyme